MTLRNEWLFYYKEVDVGMVLMGNNTLYKVVSISSVKFNMWDGSTKILADVRYKPELKRNLISLGMLDLKVYGYKSLGGVLKVIKGSMVILKGVLQ